MSSQSHQTHQPEAAKEAKKLIRIMFPLSSEQPPVPWAVSHNSHWGWDQAPARCITPVMPCTSGTLTNPVRVPLSPRVTQFSSCHACILFSSSSEQSISVKQQQHLQPNSCHDSQASSCHQGQARKPHQQPCNLAPTTKSCHDSQASSCHPGQARKPLQQPCNLLPTAPLSRIQVGVLGHSGTIAP